MSTNTVSAVTVMTLPSRVSPRVLCVCSNWLSMSPKELSFADISGESEMLDWGMRKNRNYFIVSQNSTHTIYGERCDARLPDSCGDFPGPEKGKDHRES